MMMWVLLEMVRVVRVVRMIRIVRVIRITRMARDIAILFDYDKYHRTLTIRTQHLPCYMLGTTILIYSTRQISQTFDSLGFRLLGIDTDTLMPFPPSQDLTASYIPQSPKGSSYSSFNVSLTEPPTNAPAPRHTTYYLWRSHIPTKQPTNEPIKLS